MQVFATHNENQISTGCNPLKVVFPVSLSFCLLIKSCIAISTYGSEFQGLEDNILLYEIT